MNHCLGVVAGGVGARGKGSSGLSQGRERERARSDDSQISTLWQEEKSSLMDPQRTQLCWEMQVQG
jgi:hypothetical protein